jgi:hypothetical protein
VIAGLLLVLTTQLFRIDTVSAAPTAASTAAACKRPAHGFVPDRAMLPSLGRTVNVVQVQRTSSGAVGAPPLSTTGKWMLAMDPQTLPASRKGSVLLSGHTWPDGSALGNAMLANLHTGDGFVLAHGTGMQACYRIAERASYPADQVPNQKAFRYWGSEQVVIVACSGKRLGPGNWTRRTIWYAVPTLSNTVKPPTPPPPTQAPPPNLLGALLGIL